MAETDGGSIGKLEYDPETDKIIDKETNDVWKPEWEPPLKEEWQDWRPPKGYLPSVPDMPSSQNSQGQGGYLPYSVQEKGGYSYNPSTPGGGYVPYANQEKGGYGGYSPSAPSVPSSGSPWHPGNETKVQTDVLKSISEQAPLIANEFGLGKLGVAVLKNIGDASMMKGGVPLDIKAMAKWNKAEMDLVVAAALQNILNNPLQMSYLEKWNQDEYIANLPNMGASFMPKEWSPSAADFIKQGIYMPWRGWSGAPLFDPAPPYRRLSGGYSSPVAYLPSAPSAPNPYAATSYGINWLPRYLRRI